MKTPIFLFLLSLSFALLSCTKDSTNGIPPTDACTAANDFSYPANATKFSVTLFTDCPVVTNGQEFSLKVVLYNVVDVFGFAAEIILPTDKVDFVSATDGTVFQPSTDILRVGSFVSGTNKYACGATYTRLSSNRTNGSGVVVKLRLRAKATGTAAFTINPARLEMKRSDGTPVTNFGSILVEDVSITIQ